MTQNEPTQTPEQTISQEVLNERTRQDSLWGEQNHPDGTGAPEDIALANLSRARYERASEYGQLTWKHVLDEEVGEVFQETDPAKIREELVQVAAVAMAWVAAIDRRAS